jgi:predicted AlkP superfamily pyrophosphatase or phosphodiesterase
MRLKSKLLFVFAFICLLSCKESSEQSTVVLISIDGFRHDYAERYQATNLLEIADEGVQASSLIPCYPSKTFPNHYSIITGMYPENHGILDTYFFDRNRNEFFQGGKVQDGSWYGGTPLWVLANQQGLKSASFLWLGSEADIKNSRPTYYKDWQIYQKSSGKDIVRQLVDWLKLPKQTRPQFLSAYFSMVDQAGHDFGVDSPELKKSVEEIDQTIGKLRLELKQLDFPVDLIIVSDHGMTNIDNKSIINVNDIYNFKDIYHIQRDTHMMVYLSDSLAVEEIYQSLNENQNNQFIAYKKNDIPESFHFHKNERVGDLLIVANPPFIFSTSDATNAKGTHGYDPKNEDMHGIFYAEGPNIKKGLRIKSFENIHIYPFIADILNLSYDDTAIDGDPNVLQELVLD